MYGALGVLILLGGVRKVSYAGRLLGGVCKRWQRARGKTVGCGTRWLGKVDLAAGAHMGHFGGIWG